MQITVDDSAGTRVLRASGEATLPGVAGLRAALTEAWSGGREAVLDAGGLTDIDLSGMQTICSGHRTFQNRGGNLVVRNLPECVRAAARQAAYDEKHSLCPNRRGDACVWKC